MTSAAIDAMLAVRPALVGVETAGESLGLRERELLHAGPAFSDPRRPPAPIASSIVITCLHEGWAREEADAEALLHSGALSLIPAQSRGCVVPLASIVASSTPLFQVRDRAGAGSMIHAPVSAVSGADTRMGARDGGLIGRLEHRDRVIAPAFRALLQRTGPLDLWEPARYGLEHGDDLHSRTSAANEAFATAVRERGDAALADTIAGASLFFLTPWMAASACILRAAEGRDCHTLVTRAGGNGEHFAIALAGSPGRWVICMASPPQGPFVAGVPGEAQVLGAIGDSAVIDMLGLGGQRIAHAPEPFALVKPQLEDDHDAHARRLLIAAHPALPGRWPIGVDAERVVSQACAPLVMLAMIAADGRTGFLGRGGYRPPLQLFEEAVRGAADGDGRSPWILPTTGFWQRLEPLADWDGRWTPPWRNGVPVRVTFGSQTRVLLLPIRALPGSGDRAVASLIANQASLEVAEALTQAMGEMALGLRPDVVVGLPTLGLVFAPGVARALGHARWVPLGYSRKFWYDDRQSTPVRSITSPGPSKTLYLDPNQLPLVKRRRVLLVDDAVSSAQTVGQVWDLLESLGASVVGAVVAMCQGDQWRAALGARRAQQVHGVFESPLLQLRADGWWPM